MKAWTSSNFIQIPPPTPELSALARLKIVVNTLAPTFLIGSSSFFQVMRATNKSGQSSNSGQIQPRYAELQPLINVRNWFLAHLSR